MNKSLILRQIKLHYKLKSDADFAKLLGIGTNTLANWKKRDSIDYDLILTKCEEIDANWLHTGNGEMLKSQTSVSLENKGIPLVAVTAIGGFGNAKFAIEAKDIKAYYVIPKFATKKIDFMIEVEGSSMYPKYSSGDIVACRIINEKQFIQWNKTHVIATKSQGIIIKRIKQGKSGKSLLMVSDNESYDPFEVSADEIDGVAIVVGVIRLE